MTTTRRALAATALLSVLVLTGCGGAADSGDSASGSAAVADGPAQSQVGGEKAAEPSAGDAASDADGGDGAGVSSQAAPVVTDQKIIKTAAMSVQAKDVDRAAAAVRTAVEQAKGFIADEKTSSSPKEPMPAEDTSTDPAQDTTGAYTESVLTARVPNESLDTVMAAVARSGAVLSRTQSSDDVTTKYVDTSSRVKTQRASVERVRALLTKATSLGQVVQIEGELSRREADLESLEAQLKALDNQTSLSTLTVSLTPVVVATTTPEDDDSGFLTGLSAGWTALGASVTIVLTVLGALLPFLVIAALVAVPVVVWARRRGADPQPAP
ncbi:DUF4349 domain-containing protein [Angustibacter luteus]|uniref:DUF4349 domain-containing protein n=1 Tax=Angustibacter luteus TaxID=658456 RepID=A0ABW1J9S5_9ACTN